MALSDIEKEKKREKALFKELGALAVEINRFLEGKGEFLEDVDNLHKDLSGAARRRLYGAGTDNLGFIELAYDVARGNPDLIPKLLSVEDFHENLEDFKIMQQFVFVLRKFLQAAQNVALLESNGLYLDALRVYRSLQNHTRGRTPGADVIFKDLRVFFNRPKRLSGDPTNKELERDFKSLLKGEASGEIIVANESPSLKAGKRKVVDRVKKGKRVVKVAGEESEAT
jgi:hypothetical protein